MQSYQVLSRPAWRDWHAQSKTCMLSSSEFADIRSITGCLHSPSSITTSAGQVSTLKQGAAACSTIAHVYFHVCAWQVLSATLMLSSMLILQPVLCIAEATCYWCCCPWPCREEREQRRADIEHLASSLVNKVNECVAAIDEGMSVVWPCMAVCQ